MSEKEFYTVAELAELLGVSRQAVFKRIKEGKIQAEKVGRNYIIQKEEVNAALPTAMTPSLEKKIEQGVKQVLKEYGETLRLLGKE